MLDITDIPQEPQYLGAYKSTLLNSNNLYSNNETQKNP